jgi:hypothetical protein
MHDIVVNELEEHLARKASPALRRGVGVPSRGDVSPEFQAHLASCGECRAELESIEQVSALLAELKPEQDAGMEPSPFFYTRVAAGIVEHQRKDHWGLLAPGAAFFRRVAFASLLLLAGLGSYLVMQNGDVTGTDPATIMAQHDATTDHTASSDRDLMLATLASYGQ